MHRIEFTPEARADLTAIYSFIAADAGPTRAFDYLARMRRRWEILEAFPQAGKAREDLAPKLRILGFERRATIAYTVEADSIRIQRILYAGLAWR